MAEPDIIDVDMKGPSELTSSSQCMYRLHLNDTKTRSIPSLPKDDLSGRLQLMLYHQLLSQLISPPPLSSPAFQDETSPTITFSFAALFDHLNLQADRMFSDSFIAEAAQLLGGFDAPISATEHSTTLVRCLNDLVDCWWAAVRDLSLQPQTSSAPSGPIEPNLELIYRMRGTRKQKEPKETKKGKGKAKEKDQPSLEEFNELPIETVLPSAFGLTEEEQLQLAIVESLKLLTPQADGQSSKPILEAPLIFHLPPERSGSSSPSDKDMDVIEEEAGAVGSQKSEMEWEATFAGDAPQGEEQLAVEVPQLPSTEAVPAVEGAGRQEVNLNEGKADLCRVTAGLLTLPSQTGRQPQSKSSDRSLPILHCQTSTPSQTLRSEDPKS